MAILVIFVSQFLTVFMLGFQSLMVRDNHYVGAVIGSTLIGICQVLIYNSIDSLTFGSVSWGMFILAGPLAIVCAMWAHPKILKYLKSLRST